ncbi:prohead protease/major capsid protein fusion protein [Rhodospirillum centenum]|uniref:Phage protease n=1 Tax=Rhodospirillum centenum (strain ATCC 51521 / SW) TaxID=414684 RepID=B6IMN1_RHOCS|nr:prohead protease/major capsid protein fusion protein [Rhodospirillum centenum]ACI98697.1 phage protease [Rhodospirillum centenum SW]
MSLDILTRAAGRPSTLDRAARTVEAVALSGPAPAVRPGPAPDGSAGPWVEELDAAGADLSALIGGPVLKDHHNVTDAAVGTVAGARREGSTIIAGLRFDPSEEAEAVLAKIEAGSIRGVSLGYVVTTWRPAGTRNGRPVFVAAAWKPVEISLTPLPVDSGALIRSTSAMTATTESTTDPVVSTRTETNRTIRSIATAAGLPAGWADELIDRDADADEARRLAFEAMAKRARPVDNRAPAGSVTVGTSYEDPTVIRRAMADALAHRLAPAHVKLEGQAVQYRGHGPMALLGQLLAARGERVNPWDRDALLTRAIGAHGTSDFPALLADAANKALEAQYEAAAPTYRMIAAPRSFNDFKPHKFLRVGDFPTFRNLAEGAEVQYGSISENRETVTPGEFATGIAIGRRALVNDDLGALADFSSLIAIRAAQFENATVYGLLAGDGPVLSDGKALFHADHGNKAASGSAIADGIDAAVQALRAMTGLDGAKLNLRPRYLVVGPAREAAARRILAQINPTKAGDVNPWAAQFELVVDAEITGNRWFLVAEPAQAPTLVYGYVNGAAGPQILTETDFDTQAVKVRAGLDFAAGVIDFRGVYSNAGA